MSKKKNIAADPVRINVSSNDTRNYFRRLKKRLQFSIIAAFILPLAILSIYFHFQFNMTLTQSGKLHLISLAESLRNTIDLFLQERVINIFNLFHSRDFSVTPNQAEMNQYLQNLMETSDAFVDVGFLDANGMQVGYAGPFPYLHGKDYSKENWFISLMSQEENYYISDIYMGFRNKPHTTIAVRQIVSGRKYVMRATIDPDKFFLFLHLLERGKEVDAALVNREGKYQVVDPIEGGVLGKSHFNLPVDDATGVVESRFAGGPELVAWAWLKEVPWCLVVRQPLNIAYAQMYHARRIIILFTIVVVIVLIAAIWFSTERLLSRAEETEEARRQLKSELYHAAKLVSVGELAAGVAHEINNPLAIIASQCGVIKDMFDPELGGGEITPEMPGQIIEELDIINEAVFRAKDITSKLLKSARKEEARLVDSDVNQILEDVVGGLMEKEMEIEDISLVRDYAQNLPRVLLDPDQIRQVFQNLINNAVDAIEGPGKITLSTRREEDRVKITVSDTGKGIPPEVMGRIFMPFFTTKEAGRGTGLGLGISLSIVEAMNGSITVQSIPGAGSSFTISLPVSPGNGKNHK